MLVRTRWSKAFSALVYHDLPALPSVETFHPRLMATQWFVFAAVSVILTELQSPPKAPRVHQRLADVEAGRFTQRRDGVLPIGERQRQPHSSFL